MSESRLVEVEAKLAYQEHTLQILNDVVTTQQRQIDQLEQLCKQLLERVRAGGEGGQDGDARSARDEVPPHY